MVFADIVVVHFWAEWHSGGGYRAHYSEDTVQKEGIKVALNPAQQAAVNSTATLKVVIAGPGSGKTRTMVEAVKRTKVGSRVAIMTFTNAGANEFRHRLARQPDGAGGFTELDHLKGRKLSYCGTLHGYCFKLIQRFGGFLGYIPGKVAILPDAERIPRLLQCRDKLGKKMSQAVLLKPMNRVAAEDVSLVWREYEFLLKRNNLVDYDGILRVGLELLQMTEVRCQIKLDYLFVDEYQDSAQIDQTIYEQIPAENKMYVGDSDQSIFAFRGANPMGFVHLANAVFDNSITDAEGFKLELNYRSDGMICDAANKLIAHNKERVEKQIIPHGHATLTTLPGTLVVWPHEDVGQELAWIATAIQKTRPVEWGVGSIAVLYRMNHDVKMCRDYLRSMGIPIQEAKYDQRPPDWERAMLLLGLCGAPENDILTERLLNLDHSKATVESTLLKARATGEPLLKVACYNVWTLSAAWVYPNGLLSILARNGVSESTVRLIEQRMALLAPDADLSDLLHDLHSNENTEKASDDANGVYVGTMHSAKGREFDVVFLPAFEQGIIPHCGIRPKDVRGVDWSKNTDAAIEEERRLAFVAVTRARHELYISHCEHRRGQWGPVGLGQPSQFIKEMGL